MSLYGEFRDYLSRKLQPAEPSTAIAGGGNIDQPKFVDRERDRDRLETYEAVYKEGGPVAALIDTRRWMIFGAGSEYVTQDEDVTAKVSWSDEPVTVAEWSNHVHQDRDLLFPTLARDAYVYGDWLTETVETRGGGFDRIETINPKTMEPKFDDAGQIRRWHQHIKRPGQPEFESENSPFDAEEIGHGALFRIGRHPLGISLIGRAMDQIERFEQNQEAIAEALQKHAFTRWHVQVQASVDDNELRRIRQRFHQVADYRELTTGRDIEVEPLDEGGVGESITDIVEHDLMALATTTQVPEEMAGLGRGSTEATAKVRLQAFERMGRGEQRDLAAQFIREVWRDVIDRFSPFPRDVDVDLRFADIVSDQTATAEWLRPFTGSFTHNEVRDKLDMGPVPEEADIDGDAPAADSGEGGMAGGGPFGDAFGMRGPDTGNRTLGSAGYADWERTWHALIEHALWTDEPERDLFEFDPEEVPLFVVEALRQAIDESLFGDFDSIPSAAREQVKSTLLDSLDRQHGWSVNSIASNLQETVPELEDHEAERIARSETQSLVSKARENGYRDRLDMDEETFDWVGPDDHRTTDACSWIKSQIPEAGVTMDRLKELIQEAPAHDDDIDTDPREWSPHIQCRHQPVRVVG